MNRRVATTVAAAIMLGGWGADAMGADDRVLDAVDLLVQIRNESAAEIAKRTRVDLNEAGSTEFFEIRAGAFPPDSPFATLEVRKPRNVALTRGLIALGVRTEPCVAPQAVEARHGRIDDLAPPLAGGPPGRPVDRIYRRPWGKLSFGFVETGAGECLSRVVIDWKA